MDSFVNNNNAQSAQDFEQQLRKFLVVDLTNFQAPKLIFHQATPDVKPEVFPFDVKRIVYENELTGPNMQGTRQLYAKYRMPTNEELVDLYVQTPIMQSMWGMSGYHSENNRNGKITQSVSYSLQLSFNDINTNRVLEDFYKAMYSWDREILARIFANKQKWLPGTTIKSVDALETLFTGVCTPRKRVRDGQVFPPALMLRVAKKGDQMDMVCIDKNGASFDATKILPSTNLRVIFRHRIDFKSKSIEVKNEPVFAQVMESVRPTAFADDA